MDSISYSDNCFPIYDTLYKSSVALTQDINDIELNQLTEQIKLLDKYGKDMIYVIIRIHSLRFSPQSKILDIPYAGEKISECIADNGDVKYNIQFDFANMPLILKHIIKNFIDLHMKKMKDDEQFNSNSF